MDRWRDLPTEGRHPQSESLDALPSADVVELLLEEDRLGLELALRHRDEIDQAASATKAVLDAITTAAKVRLGKGYGNLMVDLRPGSAKLRDRALQIIETIGRVSFDQARNAYALANGELKPAIVMTRRGLSVAEARTSLDAADGNLRRALESRES